MISSVVSNKVIASVIGGCWASFSLIKGASGCLYFCIISVEKLVLCVELIMMRMMGRCPMFILLSAVVILITAGKYTKNNNRERDKKCYFLVLVRILWDFYLFICFKMFDYNVSFQMTIIIY